MFEHQKLLLDKLRENNLHHKMSKCDVLNNRNQQLGHLTTENGIQAHDSKITSTQASEPSQLSLEYGDFSFFAVTVVALLQTLLQLQLH